MTKVADMDSDDFIRALQSANSGRNFGNSEPRQPSSSGSGGEGFGKLGDATARLMNSQYRASDALQDGAGIVSKVFPKLGEAMGGTVKYVTDSNDAINKMGKSGVNFANDVGQMRQSAAGAHMTLDDLGVMVRKNSTDFAGLGLGVSQGVQNQLKLNQAVLEQTDIQGSLAEQLKLSGVQVEDFATATRLVTLNSRAGMLQDKERAARATESAIELADQMDKLSKLTGLSKEQQASDLEKQMRKADVMTALLQMDDQQQQQYKLAQTSLRGLGTDVQDLASEIVTGGIRTKEGAAQMSALGPAGKEFEQALKQQLNARNDTEKLAAQQRLDAAKAQITAYQASDDFRAKTAYDKSGSGDAARRMVTQNVELTGRLEAAGLIEKTKGAPATQAEVTATQQRAIDRQTKGQDVDTGKALPGATTGQALNSAEMAIGNVSAGLASKFKDVNDTLAPTPENLRKFNASLSEYAGTAGKVVKGVDNVTTGAQDLVGMKPKPKETKTKIDESGNIVTRASGSPGIEDFLKGGSFGGMFEQFGKGTPAVLHGEEIVATKDQMTRMLSGMPGQMQGAMKGMPEQMQGMMKNMPGIGGSFNASDIMKGMEGAQGLTSKQPSLDELKKQAMSMSATASTAEKEALMKQIQAATPRETMNPLDRVPRDKPNTTPEIPKATAIPKLETPAIPKVPELPKITPPSFTPPAPPAPAPAPTPKADEGNTQKKVMPVTADVTMKDLKDQLVHLNRSIEKLVSHSADTADAAHKQVKATKSMSGNRL